MKKKMYKKPSMKMVVLNQTIAILAASASSKELPDFSYDGDPLSN